VPLQDHAVNYNTRVIARDRRLKKRYPLDLTLSYRSLETPEVIIRGGRALNMSSSGIAFTSDDALRVGTLVELSISWPVLLDGNCYLKLVVEGDVVRRGKGCAALKVKRWEFRTRAVSS
jgi:PilZ domain